VPFPFTLCTFRQSPPYPAPADLGNRIKPLFSFFLWRPSIHLGGPNSPRASAFFSPNLLQHPVDRLDFQGPFFSSDKSLLQAFPPIFFSPLCCSRRIFLLTPLFFLPPPPPPFYVLISPPTCASLHPPPPPLKASGVVKEPQFALPVLSRRSLFSRFHPFYVPPREKREFFFAMSYFFWCLLEGYASRPPDPCTPRRVIFPAPPKEAATSHSSPATALPLFWSHPISSVDIGRRCPLAPPDPRRGEGRPDPCVPPPPCGPAQVPEKSACFFSFSPSARRFLGICSRFTSVFRPFVSPRSQQGAQAKVGVKLRRSPTASWLPCSVNPPPPPSQKANPLAQFFVASHPHASFVAPCAWAFFLSGD